MNDPGTVDSSSMSNTSATHDYLLLSRGHWDANKSKEEIQAAIDRFYLWHERLVAEGKFKSGERLAIPSKLVSAAGITDGPFTETKEQLGGIMLLEARDLNHAIELISKHPGVTFGPWEIRPEADLSEMIRESEVRRAAAD